MIDTSLFPYSTFPIRLEYEDKSGKIVAFFSCEEHLTKHLDRYKLNKKKVVILRRPEDWIDTSPVIIPETKPTTPKTKKKVLATRNPRKKKNA